MRSSHIGCLGITDEQFEVIQTYQWACIECKVCAICSHARNEEQILFCDRCDRGLTHPKILTKFFFSFISVCVVNSTEFYKKKQEFQKYNQLILNICQSSLRDTTSSIGTKL